MNTNLTSIDHADTTTGAAATAHATTAENGAHGIFWDGLFSVYFSLFPLLVIISCCVHPVDLHNPGTRCLWSLLSKEGCLE